MTTAFDPPLPFPRITREADGLGRPTSEEYEIPADAKPKVLRQLYPFAGCPDVDEVVFDLHEEKRFRVGDFKVVREHGRNLLVSPYYYSTGGTVIDWFPEEDDDGDSADAAG